MVNEGSQRPHEQRYIFPKRSYLDSQFIQL